MRFCLLLAFTFLSIVARADFKVPPLTGPVVDLPGMMSSNARATLEQYLMSIREQGGAQIQVLIVPSLDGLEIEDASIRVVDQWKLGKAKEDRGVLLMIAAQEHKVRIEVGRGLEGDLPDVIAHRIIYEVIVPEMKKGSPDEGITYGVQTILHYTDPKLVAEKPRLPEEHQAAGRLRISTIFKIIFWLIVMIFFIFPTNRRRRLLGGGFYGGGLGGGGFGGGGFGGGGGGWSGGGGGFSGGGSSGSW